MGAATIGLGLALVALGIIGWLVSGRESWTALIPAIFGAALIICGGVAFKWPRPGVIAAMVVAAVGLLGVLPRLVPALASGDGFGLAAGVQLVMAIALGVFLAVGARWIWRVQKGYREQRSTSTTGPTSATDHAGDAS